MCSAKRTTFVFFSQYGVVNPLEIRGNYGATSNNMKLVYWPMMGGSYIWYREEGTGRGRSPLRPIAAPKCNSPPIEGQCIPITVLLYYGPFLCDFAIKGLTYTSTVVTVCSCLPGYDELKPA